MELIWMFLLAFMLNYIEYRMMDWRIGFFQTYKLVIDNQCGLPTQHRIVVPFIIKWLRLGPKDCTAILGESGQLHPFKVTAKLEYYLVLRLVIIWGMLVSCYYFLSAIGINPAVGVVLLSAIYPMTFLYDYLECHLEMAFLFTMLWLSTMPITPMTYIPVCLLCGVAAMNRESSLWMPIMLFGMGYSALMCIGPAAFTMVGLIIPRVMYPQKPKPLKDWVMVGRSIRWFKENLNRTADINSGDTIRTITTSPYLLATGMYIAIVLAMIFGVGLMPESLRLFCWIMVGFVGVTTIPSIFAETRVFTPALVALVPIGVKLLGV